MPFKTPDGKEFESRTEWRDYMMATFYSFKNKKNETLMKRSGDVDGQGFDIADCEGSTLAVLDACEQVQIDEVKNCRIMIGACASSIFIRNCTNCVFYTSCRQLRLRDVKDCDFYIYSMSEVHIEFSSNVRFAPFIGGYPGQAAHMATVKLDPKQNLWYDIFDHNDPMKTRVNWSLIPTSEYEEAWFPLGPCEVAVPITAAGSVANPSSESNSGMQAFGFEQLVVDAKTTAPTPAAPTDASVPPPPTPALVETPEQKIAATIRSLIAGDNKMIFDIAFDCVTAEGGSLNMMSIGPLGALWAITSTTISSSADLATCSFLVQAPSQTVSKCTAVLKGSDGSWRVFLLQQSAGVATASIKVPKSA